jgi:hypothetical protein
MSVQGTVSNGRQKNSHAWWKERLIVKTFKQEERQKGEEKKDPGGVLNVSIQSLSYMGAQAI